jgi:hypothetical protein
VNNLDKTSSTWCHPIAMSSSSFSSQGGKTGYKKSQILNIDTKDQSLWLVKVPAFVALQWGKAEHNDLLGSCKLTVTKTAKETKKELYVKLDYGKEEEDEDDEENEEEDDKAGEGVDFKTGDKRRRSKKAAKMELPVEFTLDELKKVGEHSTNYLAFSEPSSSISGGGSSSSGGSSKSAATSSYALEGSVTKNLILKPVGTALYKNFIRGRGLISKANSKR